MATLKMNGNAGHSHSHSDSDSHPDSDSDSDSRSDSHSNSHEVLALAAASASVALDIGPGRGALVIYPGERFRGGEIEISSAEGLGARVHTGVHERFTLAGSTLTAIFGSLPADTYSVWEDETTVGALVTVIEGEVAELRLS